MYHQTPARVATFWLLGSALAWFLSSFSPALAVPEQVQIVNDTLTSRLTGVDALPLPLKGKQLKQKPAEVEIYQHDRLPLGDRKPLLMVHGLRGEYRRGFRWDRVVNRLINYPDFVRDYKIYFVRFDSTASLKKTVPNFKQKVLSFHKAAGGKPLTFMALSLGGSLVHEAMYDPDIDSAVRLVFTLATPFHGSPLFCADWFQYSLYKNLSYPWTRLDHSIAYRLYFALNPNLLVDLKWDNADGFVPQVGQFHSRLPWGPRGDLTIADDSNLYLAQLSRESKIDKSKFITYSGYLLNPYLLPTLRRQLEFTILAPYTLITMKVPAHLAREHPVLQMLNHEISRIVPGPNAPRVPNWPYVYGLNDGITPVNSAIFLPDSACRDFPLASEAELSRLKGVVDVRLARVFRNTDHLTFVDGYRPRYASHLMKDELNPDDGLRTIFDWMLSDLMRFDAEADAEQLARESDQSTPQQ